MTYKQALKQCKKVGTNNATGDTLRAMYASLLTFQHGGDGERYYNALPAGDDQAITERARELLRDRAAAWEALVSLPDKQARGVPAPILLSDLGKQWPVMPVNKGK